MWYKHRSAITGIVIEDGVTSIGFYAFRLCANLESVVISDSVTSIESSAFSYCKSLTSITIPNSVTSISNYAFENCTSLESAVIGSGLKSIASYMFSNCTSLTNVTFASATPPDFGTGVFNNVPADTLTIYVPLGAKATYAAILGFRIVDCGDCGVHGCENCGKVITVTVENGYVKLTNNTTATVSTKGKYLVLGDESWQIPVKIIRPGQTISISGKSVPATWKRGQTSFDAVVEVTLVGAGEVVR